jgi:hypothetical protein
MDDVVRAVRGGARAVRVLRVVVRAAVRWVLRAVSERKRAPSGW